MSNALEFAKLARIGTSKGYGVGDGGTVTQSTSKSTAVTLNKPTGQIVMNNAALAGGASIVFILNNSLLTTSDTIGVVCTFAGGNYEAKIRNTGTGVAAIVVTNVSGGSLSEAVTLQFGISKGSVS